MNVSRSLALLLLFVGFAQVLTPLSFADQASCEHVFQVRSRSLTELFQSDSPVLGQASELDVDDVEILGDGVEALQKRIYHASGQWVPIEVLEARDPNFKIDFSRAPRLKAVFLTAFYITNDFVGEILRQIVAYHSSQGAQAYIAYSNSLVAMTRHQGRISAEKRMHYEQTMGLLNTFRSMGPNVHVELIELGRLRDETKLGPIANQLVSYHGKSFDLIGEDPRDSVSIKGGRNSDEVYYFEYPSAHSSHGEFYSVQDVETLTVDPEAVLNAARSSTILWPSADFTWLDTMVAPPRNHKIEDDRRVYKRPIFSFPQHDGNALESLYVEAFDLAQEKIRIVTPYFKLTPRLSISIESALERDVKIELVTNYKLLADGLAGGLAGAFNDLHIYKYHKQIQVYDYKQPSGQRLHGKNVLIDDRLLVVASINMNGRSFETDIENGDMYMGEALIQQYLQSFYFPLLERSQHLTCVEEPTLSARQKLVRWCMPGMF